MSDLDKRRFYAQATGDGTDKAITLVGLSLIERVFLSGSATLELNGYVLPTDRDELLIPVDANKDTLTFNATSSVDITIVFVELAQ